MKLCGIRGRSPVSLRSQLSYTPIELKALENLDFQDI